MDDLFMRRPQQKRQLTQLLFDRHLVLLSFSDSIRKSPIASKYSIPLIPVRALPWEGREKIGIPPREAPSILTACAGAPNCLGRVRPAQ